MARALSRIAISGAKGDAIVSDDVPDRSRASSEDVVLKLLHTADWHLGRRFPQFPDDAQKRLSRARMEVVGRILDLARRHDVNAVLCVGDLFDEPTPLADFWEGLAKTFQEYRGPRIPGETDLALALPVRALDDRRLRIGCVHGCTFDIEGYQTNFPISRDAGVQRGLNYLAIGDSHSFRDVTTSSPVPTVYPGTPEPTSFDEAGAGSVAVVAMFRAGLRPRVTAESVAFWRWVDVNCRNLNELRNLLIKPDLERHVVRLHLDMVVSVAEQSEVERIVNELQGTDASHGRVGVLLLNSENLRLEPGSAEAFPETLPPVIKDTIARLYRLIEGARDESEKLRATRALKNLSNLLRTH